MKSLIILLFLLSFFSCSQPEKDKDIKQMISVTAKEEPAFAGVNYTVENGVVTLSGNAPSETERDKIANKIKEMAGVKEVVNNIIIAPVILNTDHVLKKSVDSVLKKYPTIQATVQDSIIVVEGTIDSKKAQKLFNALQSLKAKGVTSQLVINNE